MPFKKALSDQQQQAFVTGSLGADNIFVTGSVAGAVANTAIQAFYPLPTNIKLSKIAVSYSASTSVAGTFSFNIIYNSGAQLNGVQTYAQGSIPANDNSGAIATPPGNAPNVSSIGGPGYPTNPAVAGQSLFVSDITINPANAFSATTANGTAGCKYAGTGWISATTTGGVGIFIPESYDAFYPLGGVLTLRLTVPAASTLTNFTVVSVPEVRPISPTYVTQTINNPQILPGSSF